MKKVIVLFKDGFEEVEALSVVDVCRRTGKIDCRMVGMDSITVTSSHQIKITMDQVFDETCYEADMVVLPGGLPGATNLQADERVIDILQKFNADHKFIGAICAGPISLGTSGVIKGKKFTCYPGFEDQLSEGIFDDALVQRDDNIITGKGPMAAFPFGYALAEALGIDTSGLKEGMQYNYFISHI